MKGKIQQWNDEKGYGFIISVNRTNRTFFHITDIETKGRRPVVGDIVEYSLTSDNNGRKKAVSIYIDGVSASDKKFIKTARPYTTVSTGSGSFSKSFCFAFFGLFCLLAVVFIKIKPDQSFPESSFKEPTNKQVSISDAKLKKAFQQRLNSYQVNGQGKVIRILPDDNKGSRHQRFIIKLNSGQTLLIAHNIDLAPRVQGLYIGGYIEFSGEYEYNNKGGVIHWTHHDPANRHAPGWLRYNNRVYQ